MSWEQLRDTLKENKIEAAREVSEPPVACPIDGEILDIKPDNTRNCPLGNYSFP
jgi:hypothetical protein